MNWWSIFAALSIGVPIGISLDMGSVLCGFFCGGLYVVFSHLF